MLKVLEMVELGIVHIDNEFLLMDFKSEELGRAFFKCILQRCQGLMVCLWPFMSTIRIL